MIAKIIEFVFAAFAMWVLGGLFGMVLYQHWAPLCHYALISFLIVSLFEAFWYAP